MADARQNLEQLEEARALLRTVAANLVQAQRLLELAGESWPTLSAIHALSHVRPWLTTAEDGTNHAARLARKTMN